MSIGSDFLYYLVTLGLQAASRDFRVSSFILGPTYLTLYWRGSRDKLKRLYVYYMMMMMPRTRKQAALMADVVALTLPAEASVLRTMSRRDGSNTLPTVLANVVQIVLAVDYRLYSRSGNNTLTAIVYLNQIQSNID